MRKIITAPRIRFQAHNSTENLIIEGVTRCIYSESDDPSDAGKLIKKTLKMKTTRDNAQYFINNNTRGIVNLITNVNEQFNIGTSDFPCQIKHAGDLVYTELTFIASEPVL